LVREYAIHCYIYKMRGFTVSTYINLIWTLKYTSSWKLINIEAYVESTN
jgi:hypothetical protein